MITIGDIQFDGVVGTLQRPKPVFEKYTRLGAKKVYIQRLRTESQESTLEAWKMFATYEEAVSHERALAENVGLPLTYTIDENPPTFGVFVVDYTYSIKAGVSGGQKWLIRYTLTVVCDEESGVEG